jgi:hypothetical protein
MKDKELLVEPRHPGISYFDENKRDGQNILKNKGPRTHDVYGGQGLSQPRASYGNSYVIEYKAGSSLALKSKGYEPTMCMIKNGLTLDWRSSMSGSDPLV